MSNICIIALTVRCHWYQWFIACSEQEVYWDS